MGPDPHIRSVRATTDDSVNAQEGNGANPFYLENQNGSDVLARMGKVQVLKRNFGFLSMFGFACTILVTWEALLALSTETLQNGGPSGLVYGFIIAWAGTLSVYNVIAELASMAPIACGQYFWVSILAPESSRRFLSYITGWLTTIAWISTLATGAFVQGTMIQGLIILNYPDYEPQALHGTLLSWAVVVVALFVNTVVSNLLPKIEGMILIVHVLGFFGVVVPMVYLSPHATGAEVFNTFVNGGNWPTQGVSFCIGMIGMVAAFVGSDAAVHMSEEIVNPALNVPRAIFLTTILNGLLGLGMIIALLFSIVDLDQALNSRTGYPYIQIFVQATGSVGSATGMAAVVTGLSICATIGFLATASRMTWAFARDNGLPFSNILSKVDSRTSIPVIAVFVVSLTPVLLTLINLGSTTVFNDVISLSVNGFYLSYLVPASLLLWRRMTGVMQPMGPDDVGIDSATLSFPNPRRTTNSGAAGAASGTGTTSTSNNTNNPDHLPKNETAKDSGIHDGAVVGDMDSESPSSLTTTSSSFPAKRVLLELPMVWGPWRIRGWLGTANNAFACAWMVFVIFWGFWPPERPVTAANMNYAVVVVGGTIGFSVVYYFVRGRRTYLGPLIEV